MNETELTELNNWYEQKNESMFLDKVLWRKEWKNEREKKPKSFFYTLILLLSGFWLLII